MVFPISEVLNPNLDNANLISIRMLRYSRWPPKWPTKWPPKSEIIIYWPPNGTVMRHHESHNYNVGDLADLNSPDSESIYNLPCFIVRKKEDRKLESCMARPIQLSMCFSCFLVFYDLRLYTGNVITHHWLILQRANEDCFVAELNNNNACA